VKDPTFLVISCSLNPASKSFRLAQLAEECFRELGAAVELLDLRDLDLPFCDGQDSKLHPAALAVGAKVAAAACILLAGPIYNYDLNAAAKKLNLNRGRANYGQGVSNSRRLFRARLRRRPALASTCSLCWPRRPGGYRQAVRIRSCPTDRAGRHSAGFRAGPIAQGRS